MIDLCDLHTHTNSSDGSDSTLELVKKAKSIGLNAIAITDHDTIDGLKDAKKAAKMYDIEVINGVELSADFETELHIVGLFIDPGCTELVKQIKKLEQNRQERNFHTIKKLNELGIKIDIEEVKSISTGRIIGRAHIARIMVNKGYVKNIEEAFAKYLGSGKPAYSKNRLLSPKEIIELINSCGGLSFLAHCHFLKKENNDFTELVKELKGYGLNGLEGYYTEYTKEKQEEYLNVCEKFDLLVSGGSDYHGIMKPGIELGKGFGGLKVPYKIVEKMKEKLRDK